MRSAIEPSSSEAPVRPAVPPASRQGTRHTAEQDRGQHDVSPGRAQRAGRSVKPHANGSGLGPQDGLRLISRWMCVVVRNGTRHSRHLKDSEPLTAPLPRRQGCLLLEKMKAALRALKRHEWSRERTRRPQRSKSRRCPRSNRTRATSRRRHWPCSQRRRTYPHAACSPMGHPRHPASGRGRVGQLERDSSDSLRGQATRTQPLKAAQHPE